MSARTVQEAGKHRDPVKKGISGEESRRQREESNNEIRKSKREAFLSQKRRNIGPNSEGIPQREMLLDPSDSIANLLDHNNNNAQEPPVLDEAMQKEIAMLPQYVAAIQGNDPAQQLSATVQIRKMLSVERHPPIQHVILSGVVPTLVQLLGLTQLPKLVFEAAWVLTNIASGSSEQTRYLVEHGAVPAFIGLLVSTSDEDLKEQAIWALGNIAGDSTQCRGFVMSQGLMGPLLACLQAPNAKLSMLRNATWTLSNLCRGKPQPPLQVLQPALPILNVLVRHSDVEVVIDACWAFSYASDGTEVNVQAVLDSNCATRMVSLLNHPNVKVQVPALRTIGNIITGTESQTQILLDNNVLPLLYRLLQSPRKALRKESCWAISNIVAGSLKHCQFVITSNVLPLIIKLVAGGDLDVKKEAAWVLTNVCSWKNPDQVKYLVTNGAIRPLCDLLTIADNKLVMIVLDTLENVLIVGDQFVKQRQEHNPYTLVIEEAEGLDKIEALQNHENQQIYEKSVKILESFFSAGEEVENMAPTVAANQQTYNFSNPGLQVPSGGFAF